MTLRAQYVERAMYVVRRHHHDHADPEVEDVRHLPGLDVAELLDLVEDPRRLPCIAIDMRVTALREHTRQVAGDPATGDVGNAAHVDSPQQCEDRGRVDDGRPQQLFGEVVVGPV